MKKFLSLVLALVMTMSLVTISAGAKDFTDADKVTYTEAVDVMSAVKVIDGYTDGSFNPTATLTRGAAAKIICNLILGPTTAGALKADAAPYSDVPANSTFAGYIAYCQKEGIISGYADGTFRPGNTLTGYAFMKMLLGALGYDVEVEGYTGANWSINVAKRALNIGLDDGLVDDFDGTKAVTREEACLYSLNTLTADMVEYDSKTTVSVGGADVVIAGSKAKEVEYKDGKYDGNVYRKDKVQQFAEKYFTNLTVTEGRDSFERPANVWKLKAETIGTYSFVADLEYTEKVKVSEIYKDLGLSSSIDKSKVEVYEDGAEDDSATIRKNDEDTKFGGQGTLTEVFYDDVDDSVIITQVNTYIGKVNRTVAATKTQDTYIEVLTGDAASDHIEKNAKANGTERFETEVEFDDDAYVLYTFSEKDDEIKAVALAESVTGVVTKVENDKATDDKSHKVLTIDGTAYKASAKVAQELLNSVSPKNEYTIYLDSYGNTIFVTEEEYLSSDYALLWDYQDGSDWSKNRALLVLADGTEKIVDTAKNYKTGDDYMARGTIVTFKQNDAGLYVLKAVKTTANVNITVAPTPAPGGDPKKGFTLGSNNNFKLENNVAEIKTGDVAVNADTPTDVNGERDTIYANSKTVFVVYNNANDEWAAYTGVKNAPSVNADVLTKGDVGVIWYCKGTSSIASIIYIVPKADTQVEDTNNNLLYVAGESVSNLIHDGDDYYTYNAVVNGKIETIKVASNAAIYLSNGTTRKTYTDDDGNTVNTEAYKLNGLYSKFSVDSDGFITKAVEYSTTYSALTKYAGAGTGLSKNSADYTVRIDGGTNAGTWTVDDDAKFYAVTTKGVITESTYGAITKDPNDKSYFIINKGMITTMVVEEVANKDNAGAASVVVNGPVGSVAEGTDVTLTLTVTLADAKNDKVTGYQWVKSIDGGTTWTDIDGETSATLKLTDVAYAATAVKYYCEVTTVNEKVNGTSAATSAYNGTDDAPYTLTVTPTSRHDVVVADADNLAVVKVNGSATLTGIADGSDVTITVQKSATASKEIGKVTVGDVELTAVGGVYTYTGKMPEANLTVTVTKVTEAATVSVPLTWNQSALLTIDGKTYTTGTAALTLEKNKVYEMTVAFAASTLNEAEVVKENGVKMPVYGTDKYYFTANEGDALTIGLPTATLTIPTGVTATWTLAGVGTSVAATTDTQVPVGATVNLTLTTAPTFKWDANGVEFDTEREMVVGGLRVLDSEFGYSEITLTPAEAFLALSKTKVYLKNGTTTTSEEITATLSSGTWLTTDIVVTNNSNLTVTTTPRTADSTTATFTVKIAAGKTLGATEAATVAWTGYSFS